MVNTSNQVGFQPPFEARQLADAISFFNVVIFFRCALFGAECEVLVYLGNAEHYQFGLWVGHLIRSFARVGREHAPAC